MKCSKLIRACLGAGLVGCAAAAAPAPLPLPAPVGPPRSSDANMVGQDARTPTAATSGKKAVDTSVFFANIEVSHDPSLQPLELRLSVRVADGPFGELTRRGLADEIHSGKLLVRLPREYPATRDPVVAPHRACSYVIDCDADAIRTLGVDQLSRFPSIPGLVAFTNKHVSAKSLSRGFDIASEVAKSREGDCSEHAVLLAALARRHHHAARVVFGFVVISFGDRLPILVGHAWTEIHDGEEWKLADAALANAGLEQLTGFSGLSYLPVQILQREDAGFRAQLVTEPGCWQVEKAESQF